MKIRPYEEGDRIACMMIIRSNTPKFFTEQENEDFSAWLSMSEREPYFVILNGEEEVVGCGGTYMDKKKNQAGFAWGMIHANYHKKGYGEAITRFRLDLLNREFSQCEHHVQTSQHTVGFYERFGFETFAVTKDGFGPGIDKCEMIRRVS